MFSLLATVLRSLRLGAAKAPLSPAAALMESADSRVGYAPHQAQELREAASAWLRVVR